MRMKALDTMITGLLVLLLVAPRLLPAQESPELHAAMDEAEVLMEKSDFKGAVKSYRKAERLLVGDARQPLPDHIHPGPLDLQRIAIQHSSGATADGAQSQ